MLPYQCRVFGYLLSSWTHGPGFCVVVGSNVQGSGSLQTVASFHHEERAQLFFFSAGAYQSCRQKTSDCPEHQGPERIHNQFFPKGLSGPSLYTFPDWLSPTFLFPSVSSCPASQPEKGWLLSVALQSQLLSLSFPSGVTSAALQEPGHNIQVRPSWPPGPLAAQLLFRGLIPPRCGELTARGPTWTRKGEETRRGWPLLAWLLSPQLTLPIPEPSQVRE